jgi:cysteine synthase A
MSPSVESVIARREKRMKIATSVLDLIGNTPMLRLNRVTNGLRTSILAKCEFMNPTGSIKDRMVKEMLEDAEKKGKIKLGSTILIEATSGNTGISLAALGAVKGYDVVIVMTEDTNREIQDLVEHFGAKLVLTPVEGLTTTDLQVEGHAIYREKAARMVRNRITAEMLEADPAKHMLDQSKNLANVRAHWQTGREILEQADGKVDALVLGVGTGGTIIGISQVLREAAPDVLIVAVEPAEATSNSSDEPTIYGIQGISDGVVPEIVDLREIDEIIRVSSLEAWHMASRLAWEEGLSVGPSSGANVSAALQVARRLGTDQNVVTLLPDRASRYLSLGLFKEP